MHKILHHHLKLHAYNIQIVQALEPDDWPYQNMLQTYSDKLTKTTASWTSSPVMSQPFMHPGWYTDLLAEFGVLRNCM